MDSGKMNNGRTKTMSDSNKKRELEKRLEEYTKEDTMLAFSGGVDSSLLLFLLCEQARKQHTKVYAVTIHTTLHPVYELALARKLAEQAGALHSVIEVNELDEAGIEGNPTDRCYRCKKYLYQRLCKLAGEKGIFCILEGTNEDDLHVYRPGIRAVRELGIKSPLAETHLTKDEVRRLAAERGIPTADRPSTPCLATRFPYGTKLSSEAMKRVEQAEDYIRSLGFYNVRLRVHGEIARLEIDTADMEKLLLCRKELAEYLKNLGYRYVTLDMEGFRSGSMDEIVKSQFRQ